MKGIILNANVKFSIKIGKILKILFEKKRMYENNIDNFNMMKKI